MNARLYRPSRPRRGAALIYVVVIVTVLMGLCSLAVDLGRYEVAHAQLYNAAVAGARAGAAAMVTSGASSSSVTTAIQNAVIANSADGQTITTSMISIEWLQWDSTTNSGGSSTTFATATSNNTATSCPAVRVHVTYTVPLVFAQVLGLSSKKAYESSTAAVVTSVDYPTVYATGNPWLAGEPDGTTASQPDPNWSSSSPNSDHLYQYDIAGTPGQNTKGKTATTANYSSHEPYASPAQVAFTVTPGATITITNVGGSVSWDHATTPFTDPTGNNGATGSGDDAASGGISEHGIADVTMPMGSMVGVFLGSGVPDSISTPPTPLNFSTQAERDYVSLAPKLQQPFYAGSGQTSGGTQQEIVVPANATRMFIGVMDSWEWNNNNGSFTPTITQTNIVTVQ